MSVIRRSRPKVTHGHTIGGISPEYQAWANMWTRCTCPSSPGFDKYGGRGIRVCERWKSFENFLADMGFRPVGLSLDREDNDGNYEPGNCRWATRERQQRNTSRNIAVTLNGERQNFMDWCEQRNLNSRTVRKRLQLGWSEADAFGTPTRTEFKYGRKNVPRGEGRQARGEASARST